MAASQQMGPDRVSVSYRTSAGAEVATTLSRVQVDEVAGGLPVREFCWYQGRKHYSGFPGGNNPEHDRL